jgi:uridine kinase
VRQLADHIVDVARPHPVRVAIDGMAAAGKTNLADELANPIQNRGRPVIRVSLDGFHRPQAVRYRRGAESPEGYYYDAFDYPAIRSELLLPLGPGGSREYRLATLDFCDDTTINEPPRLALPDAVVLCDGVFLLRPELGDCWDYRVFIQVEDQVAVRRAVRRDQESIGAPEVVRTRYWRRYVPAHRIYLEAVCPQQAADVVVDNNDPANPRVWFANQRARERLVSR